MREGITTPDRQMQLIDEREKRLIVKQELFDFCPKSRVFLSFEEEPKAKTFRFLILDERLGATFR